MKHLYYYLEVIMLLLSFTSCSDDGEKFSETGLPIGKAVSYPVSNLERAQWQWGAIMATGDFASYAYFLCSPDPVNGGYLAALRGTGTSSTVVYQFDGEGKLCYMSYTDFDSGEQVGHVVKQGAGNMWVTTMKDGYPAHQSYPLTRALAGAATRADAGSSDAFASIASAILQFNSSTGLLPSASSDPSWDKLLNQVAAHDCGHAPSGATTSVPMSYEDAKRAVYLLSLRGSLFGGTVINEIITDIDSNGRGSFYLKIKGDVNPETFSRQDSNYGEKMANKVYTGLLIGHDMNVGLGNHDYNIPGELVQKHGEVHHIVLPELPDGIYYVCPYLISEQERNALERGETVNPCWVQTNKAAIPYCRLDVALGSPEIVGDYYYNETGSENVGYNFRLQVKVPKIPEIPVDDNIYEEEAHWGIKIITSKIYESDLLSEQTQPHNGTLDLPVYISKRDFTKLDKENFRAEADVDIVLYCRTGGMTIVLAKMPYTFVYAKKPELVYTEAYLTQALCNVNPHRDVLEDAIYTKGYVSGTFWFDDGEVRYMEENETSTIEMGSISGVRDMREPGEAYDFYKHFLTYDAKSTKCYEEATVNGKELRSNVVHYVWSADKTKIEKVYLDKKP